MKRVIIPVVLIALTLVSCDKDYTCMCTEEQTVNGVTNTDSYTYKVEDANRVQAQAACNEATITHVDGGNSYETECDLTK